MKKEITLTTQEAIELLEEERFMLSMSSDSLTPSEHLRLRILTEEIKMLKERISNDIRNKNKKA